MSYFVWVLVCVNKEFGTDTVSTHVFTSEYDARIAKATADKECEGWHSLHKQTVEFK